MEYRSDVSSKSLPDMEICRAKDLIGGTFAWCLVPNPRSCRYAISFGDGFFCKHPDQEQIINNTKA